MEAPFIDALTGAVRLRGSDDAALRRILQGLGDKVSGILGFEELAPEEAADGSSLEEAPAPQHEHSIRPFVRLGTAAKNAALSAALGPPYAAPEVARLYEFPPGEGDGQCLGLIQLDGGYKQTDLDAYFQGLGIPLPRITPVPADSNILSENSFFNMEVTLDIQLAGALCPRAHLAVYNTHDVSLRGYFNALCLALTDEVNRPSVLSVSWSFPEVEGQGPTPEEVALFEDLLSVAALLGVTVCSSVGNQGGLFPFLLQPGVTSLTPAANFAATSPLVLACGGTTLAAVEGGRVTREVVWNRLAERVGNPQGLYSMATGGGVSALVPLPAYQKAARVPPLITHSYDNFMLSPPEPFAGRGTPDVASNADLCTGFRFYMDGHWGVGGGTSSAAPLWASLVLLINQGLSHRHGREVRTGWLNPLLYRLRLEEGLDIVRPITEGHSGAYAASPDRLWNGCTGLGSPRGTALAHALGAI